MSPTIPSASAFVPSGISPRRRPGWCASVLPSGSCRAGVSSDDSSAGPRPGGFYGVAGDNHRLGFDPLFYLTRGSVTRPLVTMRSIVPPRAEITRAPVGKRSLQTKPAATTRQRFGGSHLEQRQQQHRQWCSSALSKHHRRQQHGCRFSGALSNTVGANNTATGYQALNRNVGAFSTRRWCSGAL